MKRTKPSELKACRRAITRARERQAMYQKAADDSPDDVVRRLNQQRSDWAKDDADTYERWLEEHR